MDPTLAVSVALIITLLAFVMVIRHYRDRLSALHDDLAAMRRLHQERLREPPKPRGGGERWAEQWAPVLSGYPYDPQRFRFVGGPADGVQFEDDRIVFVSFDPSREDARRARELVLAGRVEWVDAGPAGASDVPQDTA